MTDLAFALDLGDGLYIDSNGGIHHGPAPATVIYEAPFKLPIDVKVAGSALKDVKEGLDDFVKNPGVLAKFEEYGFDLNALKLLSSISKIAGTIAPFLAVAGVAIDVLKMFGLFKDGPSALETLVKARFDKLDDEVEAISRLIEQKDLRDGRIAVENFTAAVRDHVAQLNNSNPSIAQLESDRALLIGLHGTHLAGIASLVDQQTWQLPFNRDEHTTVWQLMQHLLFTHPGGPASLPPHAKLMFDHRLMIPLATHAAEAYLACIRGITPEYRTTGDFRSKIRDLANAIEDTAQAMREHVLARTIYEPKHFESVLLYEVEVIRSPQGLFEPDALSLAPQCNRFPVGSLDLRYHNDDFFAGFFTQLVKGEFFGWAHETKHAGMDFRWLPPAKLAFERHEGETSPGVDRYRITNPEECAAAANAQSEKDYADLLSLSGYTQLLQLGTLYLHEATEPSRSQTVEGKVPELLQDPQPTSSVTIASDPIFGTGVITSSALREPQRCKSRLEVWTQPIKRARPVEYKVKLRTLSSIADNRWREYAYADYQFVHYEQEPGGSRFKELVIDERGVELDSHLMIAGSSPREGTLHRARVVQMKAHTFDWWIPIKPPFSLDVPLETTVSALRGIGWSGTTRDTKPKLPTGVLKTMEHNDRRPIEGDLTYIETFLPDLTWRDGSQDWDGQHRDPREATVTIDYTLDWTADRLHVSLKGEPVDRNYVVYVVVEEKLPGSGKVLHTAVPIPVNGQLTYVPQAFFDKEQRAIAKAAKAAADFVRKYSKSVVVGPVDPIIGWARPGDLASTSGVATLLRLAQQHQPRLLREVETEL